MSSVYASSASAVRMGYEPSYGTAATTFFYPCHRAEVNITKTKRIEEITRIGILTIDDLSPIMLWEISGTINGWLSNPWFLRSLYNNGTSGTPPPQTHTYSSFRTEPLSLTIDSHYTRLIGVLFTGFTVSGRHGEPVTVSIPFISGHAPVSQAIPATAAPDTNVDFPFSYFHGSITGTYTYGVIREFTLRVDQTIEILRGIGAITPTGRVATKHVATLEMTVLFATSSLLNEFINDTRGGSTSTIVLNITNGLTGANTRRIEFTVTGPYTIENYSYTMTPNSLIEARFTIRARQVTALAQNNVNTHP